MNTEMFAQAGFTLAAVSILISLDGPGALACSVALFVSFLFLVAAFVGDERPAYTLSSSYETAAKNVGMVLHKVQRKGTGAILHFSEIDFPSGMQLSYDEDGKATLSFLENSRTAKKRHR